MKQAYKQFGYGVLAVLSLLTVATSVFPVKAHAQGETYTWKDYNTITVSGGDLKGSVDLKLQQGSNPQHFIANPLPQHNAGCSLDLSLTLDSDTSGTTHARLPYIPTGPESRPNGVVYCSDMKTKNVCSGIWPVRKCHKEWDGPAFPGVSEGYDNKTVTIGGTRPGSNQQSETDLERSVVVTINSPNPNSSSPSSVDIFIKDASGQVVASLSPSKEAALGSTDPNNDQYVDPDIQPVYYVGTFHLDPGKYVVCADIVITDCRSFEKVKFKALHLEYGDLSTKRTIKVTVHVRYIGGVQNMTIDPFDVSVTKPSGEVTSQKTNSAQHTMTKDEEQAQGLVQVTYEFWPFTVFNGINPGTYLVCVDGVPDCQKIVKKVGEPAEVTFEVDWNAFNSDNNAEKDCKDKYRVIGTKGVTYLICSVIDTGTYAVGALDGAIANLLTIDTKDIFADNDQGNAYHLAWSSSRYFALGLIVIAALLMVVAQAIGSELVDAYTVRKVLPRLLFAAVFVTLSWDVLEFLANLSNDAGNGIRQLIYAPFRDMPHGSGIGGGTLFVLTMLGTGGALALGWVGLLSFVVTGLLASLVAVAVLVLRKMVIILLIMIAPFAIAASTLPNTRKAYDKWRETLVAVLVVFPIITAFIAIGRIFSVISFNAAQNMNATGGRTITQIMAFIAYFAPYFLITFAFKLAGGTLATLGGIVNDRSKGAFDRLRNFRGNKVNQNLGKMATGERFQGNNALARAFNATTFGATVAAKTPSKGALLNPASYLTRRGRTRLGAVRQSMLEQQRSLNATKHAESDRFKAIMHNDAVLRALTYANEAMALTNMADDFGMSQEAVEQAVAGANANGGFSRNQQLAAVKQLFVTGTGYDNLQQAVKSIGRVAGDNSALAMSIIGEGNFVTGQVGRSDLKVGFTPYVELYQAERRGDLSEERLDSAYVNAVKEHDASSTLRGKPRVAQNIAPALQRSLTRARDAAKDVSLTPEERDRALEESGRLAGIIEQLQSNANMFASPTITKTIEEDLGDLTQTMREDIQQEASPVVLVRNPTTGRMEPQVNQTPNGPQYVQNLRQDESTAQGYNQQRPRR